jgi:hypothetical protein
MHYYSKTTMGFYDPEVNSIIPEDAVLVADSDYLALFSVPAGVSKKIVPNSDGYPILVDN